MVRAGVRCCACALFGLRVAHAPCPGVLLRRRGDTPSLWRARLAPLRALLAPGCGPVRCSGVCVRWGGGGLLPLPSPSQPCPSVPLRRPALPVYPLRTRWVGLGWTVGLGGLTWCFFPAGRRGLGSFYGAGCSCGVPCRAYGVLGLLAPVHQRACPVCGVACAVFTAAWLLFTGVHTLCVVLCVRCRGPPGSCSPVCTLCVWWCVYGVLGLLAPVHRCARSACGIVCTVSWASWLLFTGVHALCVVLRVRCPRPPGSCSPVCTLCVWCCVYGVLGLLAPVHRCARSVCGVACTVSSASWLLFTGVHTLCVVLRVRRPGPPGSCSPVCTLCVWCCVYGVLGLLALVHRCARSVCGVACTVSWASRLLFTGVHALCVVLRVRCPGPPGSCSPVCTLCVWCCVYSVLGLLARVHRCARSVCGVACTASWASWLLFTGVHALCAVLCARCPGPPGSCSPVYTLCVWCCVYGVLGLLAPVHRCARSVCGVACTVSWASWLLFTGVHALCVVLRVRRPGPPGSCSPVCTLCVWCCVYGVLGLLAPVHRCARSVCGVACTASWASWLLFTRVHALCVVVRVRCPRPPGSCSPASLCVWCCVYGVLGLLAPVHRCAGSVRGVACTVSWASWFLFTGVHPLCVVLPVRCSGPPGSCSPVCTLCVWCCLYSVLGLLAPVHRCARSVCGVVCAVSRAAWLLFTCVPGPVCCVVCTAYWAPWLPFTGVHALCAVLCVRCPGPLGSCSPVRVLVVRCGLCRVLGFLAPVLWRARSVCGVVCMVSWAFWPFCAGVLVWCVLCCVCGVLGHFFLVLRCPGVLRCVWCPVCGVACAMSWASRPLFTGAHARCVVLCGRCPGPLGSCSPVCLCGVLCGVCGVLGHLAPVHWCARVACVVSRVRCPGPRGSCSPACCVLVWCVVCCVRCPGPLGSCSLVCVLGVLRGVCGVGVGACSRAPYRCSDVADSLFFVYTWIDTVGNAAANSPLASRPPRRPASYGVLLLLPVLDSLILTTPESKRVLMHAWRCMLFTR